MKPWLSCVFALPLCSVSPGADSAELARAARAPMLLPSYGRRAVRYSNLRNCVRQSKLELRGLRNGLKTDP
eukprot:13767105-Alexandrium_andersonii.AAC.1